MRTLVTLSTVSMLALFSLQGCKKKDTTTPPVVTPAQFMKATVGVNSFSVTGTSQAYSSGSSSGGLNYIYIYGVAANKQSIKITLINNAGTGTTAIGTGNAAAEYAPYGFDSTYSNAVSGSVTLTALTPNIVGTFNFTCADSTQVTNGSFLVVGN